jgi:cell fate regulator YaaT (PSP1 superfamily)
MYEHKTYVEARRRFPREGKTLRTSLGEEKVVSVEILKETVTLRSTHGEHRTVSLEELKGEIAARPE